MSIGIYAFLRIYFLGFGVSVFAQFRTRCESVQRCAVCPIYAAWAVCIAALCIWLQSAQLHRFRVRWPVLLVWG